MSERRRASLINEKAPAPIFEHFHSFKEFMQLQADSLEPGTAVELYDQYKYDFKVFSARKLFAQSQERGFVFERYSPENLRELCLRKIKHCRANAQIFMANLEKQTFAALSLAYEAAGISTLKDKIESMHSTAGRIVGAIQNLDIIKEDGKLIGPPYFAVLPSNGGNTLVLKKLPADVTTRMLEALCADLPGFRGVILIPSCLTDEHRIALMLQATKDAQDCSEVEQAAIQHSFSECYVRAKGGSLYPLQTAWIEFDSDENCLAAETAIDQKPIGDVTTAKPQRLRANPERLRRINLVSVASMDRLNKELAKAKDLIQKLDNDFAVYKRHSEIDVKSEDGRPPRMDEDEKDEDQMNDGNNKEEEAEFHPFLSAIDGMPLTKALDLCCLYLRRVHYADFYAGKICWSPRELVETCGPVTCRLVADVPEDDPLVMRPEDALIFDRRIDALLNVPYADFLVEISENHSIFAEAWDQLAKENTLQVLDEEKYRCAICNKLFKGAQFVHKHLRNKHHELICVGLKECAQQMMFAAFEADDAKLLLFVTHATDYMKVFPNNRSLVPRDSSSYGPARRTKTAAARSTPITSFRDWDAPRWRLEEKAAGGNFRTMVRYDDL